MGGSSGVWKGAPCRSVYSAGDSVRKSDKIPSVSPILLLARESSSEFFLL